MFYGYMSMDIIKWFYSETNKRNERGRMPPVVIAHELFRFTLQLVASFRSQVIYLTPVILPDFERLLVYTYLERANSLLVQT